MALLRVAYLNLSIMKILLLVTALLYVTGPLVAQYDLVGSPIISHFEKSDYHAGSQNWVAVQDERGIMYFGNNRGILEFDGTSWHTLSLPNSTIVRSLAFDEQGRLYVGGQDEIGFVTSDETGTIIYKSLTNLVPETQRNFEDIWKIFSLRDQIIFC